nr:ASN_HP1_G0000750.mRNA.1.CDS.1 [Saccharomyces cerevisiae]
MTELDWRGKIKRKPNSDWKIYILTLWNIFCWNDSNVSIWGILWLKSLKDTAIPKLNQLSMITPGLGGLFGAYWCYCR